MDSKNIRAHAFLLISGLLFGANYWIAKGLMPDYLNPVSIILFRTAGASALFLILLPFVPKTRLSLKEWGLLALSGLTGVTINQYLFFAGLERSSPVETSVLHTISPLVVLLFAYFVHGEGITLKKTTGICCGFAGALIITLWGKEISFASSHFSGNILILVNIISYSLYLVLVKPIMDRHNPLFIITLVFLSGFLFFLPVAIYRADELLLGHFPAHIWISLIYVVVGTTFLTYLLTVFALRQLSSSVVGFYIYIQPIISSAIGIISGREFPGIPLLIAGILIFTGIFLVTKKRTRIDNGQTHPAGSLKQVPERNQYPFK